MDQGDIKFIEEPLRFQNGSSASRREAVRSILRPSEGRCPPVCLCGMPRFEDVEVHLSDEPGKAPRAQVAGSYKCGNPHVCTDCAVIGAAARAETYRQADEAITKMGGKILVMTLTLAHDATHSLKDSLDALNKASRHSRQGRVYKQLTEELGCCGALVERHVRYNPETDSWHVHLHITMFLASDDTEAIDALGEVIKSRYVAGVEKLGRRANLDRQWSKVLPSLRDTEYTYPADHERPAQGDEGEDAETAGSWSPFELAERAHASGDKLLADRFREYASATKGTRNAILTKAMAEKLGIARSAAPQKRDDTKLGLLPGVVWKQIRCDGADGQFLRRVESGGKANWPKVRHWAFAIAGHALPASHFACTQLAEIIHAQNLAQDDVARSILNDFLVEKLDELADEFGYEVAAGTLDCVQFGYRSYSVSEADVEALAGKAEKWAAKLERRPLLTHPSV